ncbi:O-acyltransferase WSD1 [Dichanthelium oligosanthes]|uniref:O-acyltransferase WSD1 n=1 Tax=Dichanthelium oligosanthes TaxID=888268 RepID=A0A1E5UWP1_9POAL|nr:O-acyltransferase WSD1 [Dichanthelium oligosanthes]
MDAGATDHLRSVAAPSNRSLSVRATRAPDTERTDDATMVEPVSPTGRLMDGFYIVVTIGLGTPVNLPAFRAGIESQLARHPRFRSIQVTDGSEDGNPHWAPATVNLDDHVVVPGLDPAAVAVDPDQAVEDYVASLSTLPMDRSRPLWDFHFLDFPTSEAAATVAVRAHHSLGDGMAMLTLLIACTRSAADPARLPAKPTPPARSGPIYARPRPPASAGPLAFATWLWSFVVLAWHTVADVVAFAATVLFVSDPHTLFKRTSEGKVHRKRFVHTTLSLDEVKFVKNAMKCTVNDVLIGVTSAALSQYYFRESGDTDTRKLICLRSVLLVNLRPPASLQSVVEMIESGKSKAVKWGNKLGYIILPFHIAMHDDPLEYVRTAKKTVDRKKSSLEALFTHAIGEMVLKFCGVKVAATIFGRMISHTTISFSNMVGPGEQVEFCGHPVAFIAPSVYGPPEALTVHYQSYGNTVKVILAVDEAHFACRKLLDDFASSLRRIRDAAKLQQYVVA